MGKKYLEIKENSLESSVFNILHGIQEEKEVVAETNKNDKSDDGDGMDAVQPKAVKKKFANRKDKDIDNDGDVDSSDKYLHKRRKAVSKAITKKEGNAFGMALKSAKDKGEKTFVVSGKTYSVKEEVDLDEAKGIDPKTAKIIAKMIARGKLDYNFEYGLSRNNIDDIKKQGGKPPRGVGPEGGGSLYDLLKGLGDTDNDIYLDGADLVDGAKTIGKWKGMTIGDMLKKARLRYEEVEIDEGKMSQMHQMIKDKKTPAQIAKAMGLDLKTVKALMDGYSKMVPESFEIGTEKYLKHTVNVTPGQKEWTETVTKKAASMRETLAKMWGVDEGKNVFEKDAKKDLTSEVKGGTTMTGKKVADIDTKPTIKEKKK